MLRRGVRMEFRFKDRHKETEAIEVPRGSSRTPLTWDDVVAKFKPLVSLTIGHNDQFAVIDAVANIENMGGAGFARVLRTAVERNIKELDSRTVASAGKALSSRSAVS